MEEMRDILLKIANLEDKEREIIKNVIQSCNNLDKIIMLLSQINELDTSEIERIKDLI